MRLKPRILALAKTVPVKMFAANDVVPALGFTRAELAEFDTDNGQAIVVAVEDFADLERTIPAIEDGLRNYYPITNERVIARLDPFAAGQK